MTTIARSAGSALSIQDAVKVYPSSAGPVTALDGCSLNLAAGEFVAIVGPSGCGKSTLLNVIAGFDTLSAGHVLIDGEVLAAPGVPLRPGADRMVVFQQGALFPWKTVLENVAYGPITQGRLPRREAETEARRLLASAGLEGTEDRFPGQLSSGMRRRVEIVRALINRPRVLLLDEPFRALDARTKAAMHQHLLDLYHAHRTTVFFVTHDLDEAIYLSDRVVAMTTRPGRVKVEVPVNLPRPRSAEMRLSATFEQAKAAVVAAIHEEARLAFQRGEAELGG